MNRTVFATLLASVLVACASDPQLRKAPALTSDALELFRRARFMELTQVEGGESMSWAHRLRPRWIPEGEDVADWSARVHYRRGDAKGAWASLNGLPKRNHTRRLLTALLENADRNQPLRHLPIENGELELRLDPDGLDAGLPIVLVNIRGREFRMLWDTGATENVLGEEAVKELDLVRSEVQFAVHRDDDGYVVRFGATATEDLDLGSWKITNVPWLIAPVDDDLPGAVTFDGFLSPQLLLRDGCFFVDRLRGRLQLAVGVRPCRKMMAAATGRSPVFRWNGEVFANGTVARSPEVAVKLETGSPVSFLKVDATRYLPTGTLTRHLGAEREIASDLAGLVDLRVGDQNILVNAIDLEASRRSGGHDDIATVGTDLLLSDGGLVLSFATLEMGYLPTRRAREMAVAAAQSR